MWKFDESGVCQWAEFEQVRFECSKNWKTYLQESNWFGIFIKPEIQKKKNKKK